MASKYSDNSSGNIVISSTPLGIELYQRSRNKTIVIPSSTWDKLKIYSLAIDEFLQLGNCYEWDLEEGWKIKVTDKLRVNGECKLMIDLRKWIDGKPTHDGITFRPGSWRLIKQHLHDDVSECSDNAEEYYPIRTVDIGLSRARNELGQLLVQLFANALRSSIWGMAKDDCYGCRVDHPSQTQHPCLYSDFHVNDYFEKAYTSLYTLPLTQGILENLRENADFIQQLKNTI